jgi:hypothetical protein
LASSAAISGYQRVTLPQKPKIYVLVDEGIFGYITMEINRYMMDLRAEGRYEPVLYHRYWTDEVEVKNLLRFGYTTYNMAGALFVGDIPVAFFEMDDNLVGSPVEHVTFPMDLFYMDMDGWWEDTDSDGAYDVHVVGSGDLEPEVFVGRLYASTITIPGEDEVSLIRNYFDKNHDYRTGNLQLNKRALVFVDNPWDYWANQFDYETGLLYSDHDLLIDYPYLGIYSDADTYRDLLDNDYEWISLYAHSSQYTHAFEDDFGNSEGRVTSFEISQIDPQSNFYNLFACKSARYTYSNNNGYIGGHYIFAETYGVCAIGSTKSGGMFQTWDFYCKLAHGYNMGEALIEWFTSYGWTITPQIPNPDDWSYGMVILGDPTLVPNMP